MLYYNNYILAMQWRFGSPRRGRGREREHRHCVTTAILLYLFSHLLHLAGRKECIFATALPWPLAGRKECIFWEATAGRNVSFGKQSREGMYLLPYAKIVSFLPVPVKAERC